MPINCTEVAVNEALILCVMTSITMLLVVLGKGIFTVLVLLSLSVASMDTSWHVKKGKVLLILVSIGAAQKDTLGFSLAESTLYVRLTSLMVAILLNVNST